MVGGHERDRLEASEVLVNNSGGGGGYGNPFEREPEWVAHNGFVPVATAACEYGVVVRPETFHVLAATARLRSGEPVA